MLRTFNRIRTARFTERSICTLGNPQDGKFRYPAEKRRTRDSTNTMRAAEAHLDAFWDAADTHWLRNVGTTPHTLVKHILGERTIQRTPPWEENPKPQQPTAHAQDAYVYRPFSATHYDQSKDITGAFDKLSVSTKDKVKIRGLPTTPDALEPIPTPEAAPEQGPIIVDKRAQRVFKALFHSPNSPDQPGEIAWPDFLHAMVSTGFSAEKLQGSAWQFTPRSLDVERSIQFHEPHPGNKLPFTWARRYGRRLTRAYGWEGGLFVSQ
ncbi:hypothetical protein BDV95DRAFT_556338 [Massariosphaeria phaeospora]|uniref:Uncharacterized protein n=1 Tax=Massariosphaeria phaeospora TaxID=100035 RepID=A0A7C8IIE3_9PLEO|nr:hypothetical protein BDV95DRAFT_556338 [Massariosphaeria phaeospora]